MRALLEHAVEDLATGPGLIQQRLADTYLYCHLGENSTSRFLGSGVTPCCPVAMSAYIVGAWHLGLW